MASVCRSPDFRNLTKEIEGRPSSEAQSTARLFVENNDDVGDAKVFLP